MIRRQGGQETSDRRRGTKSQDMSLAENEQRLKDQLGEEENERIRKRNHEEAFSAQIMTSSIVASAWDSYRQASPEIHKQLPDSSPRGRIIPKPLSCKCKLSRS